MIIKKKKNIQPEVLEENSIDLPLDQEDDLPEMAEDYAVEATETPEGVSEKDITEIEPDDVDLFNLDNIDFKQRQERRRGDRRRGFRRVEDRNLVSRAREEADSIREAASKEGYQQGLAQAVEDLAQIREALNAFVGAPQEVFDYIAPEILEISVDIAQKIIKKEVSQNPEIVLEKITEILKTLPKEEPKVTIRVNPMQVSIAKQAIPDMLEAAGLDTKIVVLQDEAVTEGGCIVTTNNGVIDATIESQIAIVKEALKEV